MTRLMYDACNYHNIPSGAGMVATYRNHPSCPEAPHSAFPNARMVIIAGNANIIGRDVTVLDVENTDATPDQVPGWVSRQRNLGVTPACYVNRGNWQTCKDACARAGVAEPLWWLAFPGATGLIPGTVATQFAYQGGYDVSYVADHWPGIDPAPQPKDDDMTNKRTFAVPPNEDGGFFWSERSNGPGVSPGQWHNWRNEGGMLIHWYDDQGRSAPENLLKVANAPEELADDAWIMGGVDDWGNVHIRARGTSGRVLVFQQSPTGPWGCTVLPLYTGA